MKRKVFLQVSVVLYIALALFLAIMATAIYVIVYVSQQGFSSAEHWIGLIAAIGGFGFMAYLFIKMARNKIVLNSTEIFVPEHWGGKENKIQYEAHIPYASIKHIFMTTSTKNSKGKSARWVFTPMPYIVFELKDDKQASVNVLYFTKKQTARIIDESIARARELDNDIESKTGSQILSELMDLQKTKKK